MGGWSQLFGLGGEPSQEAQERVVLAAQDSVQRLSLLPGDPSTGEQSFSSKVPYKGGLLAWSVLRGRAGEGFGISGVFPTLEAQSPWGCAEGAGRVADPHP